MAEIHKLTILTHMQRHEHIGIYVEVNCKAYLNRYVTGKLTQHIYSADNEVEVR